MTDENIEKEILIEYVERFVPDLPTLAKYIKCAKGPDRTMEEFAKECNVSGSTLSRIANGKITRRISKELADNIMRHSVKQNMFDYKMLMRANGMVPADAPSERRISEDPDTADWYYGEKNIHNTIKNVMSDELSRRDFMFNFGRGAISPGTRTRLYSFGRRGDFTIRVQGYEPMFWNFFISYDPTYRGEISRHTWIRDWSEVFLTDIWAPDQLSEAKTSFIFINEETYHDFVAYISKRKVNNDMSAIYIDVNNSKYVEETVLPRNSGKPMKSLMETPAHEDYDEPLL